jgi:predicted aldo/keto reductase-like oxidoreductase
MMEMIRRDQWDLLDGMLVAINPNDKQYLNHQFNVIPVAQAKNLGIIAMKVFADGAMYSKESRWSGTPEDVVRSVGTKELPSKPLVEYALTTPGIHTAIIGIGQISDDPLKCQLVQNYYAAQISPDGMSEKQRLALEEKTGGVKNGQTNWFQLPKTGLTPPQNIKIETKDRMEITWDSAVAAETMLSHYEVFKKDKKVGTITHEPQTTAKPFGFKEQAGQGPYKIVAVDLAGNRAESEEFLV